MNVKNIINGWSNFLKSKTVGAKNYIESQAAVRMSICQTCELNSNGICATREAQHTITGETTNGCGCPLGPKTMSKNDQCPLGKWHAMVSEEIWEDTLAIADYDKLVYASKDLGKDVLLYNQKENGVFVSADAKLIFPYVTLGWYAGLGFLSTPTVYDAIGLLTFNERAKIFGARDSFIEMLKTTKEDKIILWIPMILAPENTNTATFIRACDFCMQDIANRTGKYIQYIYTLTPNADELKTHLDRLGVYYERSQIPTKLQDLINSTKNDN